jgi:hypothetical protein
LQLLALIAYASMPQVIVHKTIKEFIQYNEEYIFADYIAHYNLIKLIENRKANKIQITNAFNIIDDDGSFILCLVSEGLNFNIYGSKRNNQIVSTFSEYANFPEGHSNLYFSGNRAFILELAEHNKFSFEVFKDRLIYECVNLSDDVTLAPGTFGLALGEDLDIISSMCYSYSQEEYGKHAQRSAEYMRNIAQNGIAGKSIYKWEYDKQITSIAQAMISENGFPIIGQFYTSDIFRKKGYGTSLLFSLTQLILENDWEKCGLISDINSLNSNAIFRKVGYVVVYETISITTK